MRSWSTYKTGVVLAIAGTLLFSTKAVFVKLAYQYDVDSVTLLLLRMLFALPFYLFMIGRSYRKEVQKWKGIAPLHWMGLVVASFLGYYLSSLLDFLGLQYIDASVERLVLFIYPTFIALMSALFLREKVTRLQMIALALSYVGLVFVFGQHLQDVSWSSDFWKGTSLILLCALTFASFLVISQWLIPHFGATSFTSLSMALACLFVIAHFLSTHGFRFDMPGAYQVYVYAFIMATLATILPSYLVNYAISHIGATRSAIISSVGPISTISLAYWLLDERLSMGQLVGALLILIGVRLVSLEMRRKKELKKA